MLYFECMIALLILIFSKAAVRLALVAVDLAES